MLSVQQKEGGDEQRLRLWIEQSSSEVEEQKTAVSSVLPSSVPASLSSSDPFKTASSMLKGGEGPLTENSSFDLASLSSNSSSSSSVLPPSAKLSSSASPSSTRASSSPSSSQYRLLGAREMSTALDSFQLPPLSRVLLDWRHEDGTWSRVSSSRDFREFRVGDSIDALDTIRKWYESTVRDIKDGRVFVHFKSWGNQWDEWIDTESDRLAPLHTHTTPTPVKPTLGLPSSSSSSSLTGYSSSSYSFSYNHNEEGRPHPSGAVGLRNLGNTYSCNTDTCTHIPHDLISRTPLHPFFIPLTHHLPPLSSLLSRSVRCFMNSILQSMAHCPLLTRYFLSSSYLSELNRQNPLGWNGRIAEEYGGLLSEYWSNRFTVVAPKAFKQALGEFQPRFSGYQQHDSSELLSFLLDGLHEDLNRVLQKPHTQAVDSGGRPDEVVAKEAWDVYLLRNQSIIVDYFMGQLKSRVVCPVDTCGRVSITFDPFCLLSLPLPTVNDFNQTIHVVYADPTRAVTRYNVVTSKVAPLSELIHSLSLITAIPSQRLVLADVWNHKLWRVLEEDSSVGEIRPSDTVYAYELPELDGMKPADAMLVQLCHFKVNAAARESLYEARSEQFGLPRVIALNKKQMVTGKQVAAMVQRVMRGWVKPRPDQSAVDSGADRSSAEWLSGAEGESSTAMEGDTQVEGEAQLEDAGQVEGETPGDAGAAVTIPGEGEGEGELNTSYVLVKSPQDDALMHKGEPSEGEAGEDMAEEGVTIESSPSSSTDSASAPATDAASPYRVVMLDGDAHTRSCFRCPASRRCSGCPLPIDDEALALLSTSEPSRWERSDVKLTLGLEWDIDIALPLYNADRETPVDHSSSISTAPMADEHGQQQQRVHLSDCIAAFTKEETLSEQDPWFCSSCKDFRCATKKMDLFSLPRLLIIHLKRFAYTSRSREKISTFVDFPITGLDLSHLAHPSTRTSSSTSPGDPPLPALYDLWAVSNHMGGLGGGHYTAYVKNRVSGQWFLHDDSRVHAVPEEEIKTSSAYVLFFAARGLQEEEGEVEGRGGGGGEGRERGEKRGGGGEEGGGEESREGTYMELSDGGLDADGVPRRAELISDHFGRSRREGEVAMAMDDTNPGSSEAEGFQ